MREFKGVLIKASQKNRFVETDLASNDIEDDRSPPVLVSNFLKELDGELSIELGELSVRSLSF